MWIVRMVFDLLAQLADVDAEILRVFGMRRAPDCGQDLLVGEHAAGREQSKVEHERLLQLWTLVQLGGGR